MSLLGVRDLKTKKTKNGKSYYDFKGYVDGKATASKIWDIGEELKSGDVIECSIEEDSYRGKRQYVVRNYKKADVENSNAIFGIKEVDTEGMFRDLLSVADTITDPDILALTTSCLETHKEGFVTSVAAKSNHHNYKGGLLNHTHNVTALCLDIAKRYDHLDHNILISSAILHDIGKMRTYEHIDENNIEYNELGHFMEHLVVGSMMVRDVWKDIGLDENDTKLNLILHCILSHHGQREWGSPVVPTTIEAQIVHLADMVDSRIGLFENQVNEYDGDGVFTDYCQRLGTQLYVGGQK